jgi:hypothetical protein
MEVYVDVNHYRTVFARWNAVIVGSNPTQGMDVCVCVVLCVGSGLATG